MKYSIILLFFAFVSCSSTDSNTDKTIIGEWKTVSPEDLNGVVVVDPLKFTFYLEGVGFVMRNYIFKGDSLFFYNISNSDTLIIVSYLVEMMNNDNMKLSRNEDVQNYERISEKELKSFVEESEKNIKDIEIIEEW